MRPLTAPTLDDIQAARGRLAGVTVRTPLLRLNAEGTSAEIWIKLENLQPIGSFKLRGAANAMRLAGPQGLRGRRLHGERRQHGPGSGVERS